MNIFGYDDDQLNQILLGLMQDPTVMVQVTLDKSQSTGVHEKQILQSGRQPGLCPISVQPQAGPECRPGAEQIRRRIEVSIGSVDFSHEVTGRVVSGWGTVGWAAARENLCQFGRLVQRRLRVDAQKAQWQLFRHSDKLCSRKPQSATLNLSLGSETNSCRCGAGRRGFGTVNWLSDPGHVEDAASVRPAHAGLAIKVSRRSRPPHP